MTEERLVKKRKDQKLIKKLNMKNQCKNKKKKMHEQLEMEEE